MTAKKRLQWSYFGHVLEMLVISTKRSLPLWAGFSAPRSVRQNRRVKLRRREPHHLHAHKGSSRSLASFSLRSPPRAHLRGQGFEFCAKVRTEKRQPSRAGGSRRGGAQLHARARAQGKLPRFSSCKVLEFREKENPREKNKHECQIMSARRRSQTNRTAASRPRRRSQTDFKAQPAPERAQTAHSVHGMRCE